MDETKLLGTMPIPKLLRKFSVPCVTGLLIGAIYNIVDQIFIGNSSLGYLGNAATGISFPLICIANAFAWCIGDGGAAYLSICAGREDSESSHKCVGTAISSTLLISFVLSLFCLIFCRPLMMLFGASDATLTLACDYFNIIAFFFPPYLLLNVMNSMIRADGSPSYAMGAMLSGAVINIILDPICIFLLNWGIKGAAIATVIGQITSFVICIAYLRKPKSFSLSKESFKINLPMLRNLITLGGSTFIIQISLVVMTLLTNVMLFKYGELSIYGSDIPISVYSIQTKVYTIVNNVAVGIALGGQPILGYNYGAKKMNRVKETYKLIVKFSVATGIIAAIVFLFFPQAVICLFGKQNPLYMEFAVKSFRISLCLSFVTCFIKLSSIFFQAIGKAFYAMAASLIRDMFCFVSFTLVLCKLLEGNFPGKGIYGILIAAPLSDLVAGAVIAFLTYRFFRELSCLPEAESSEDSILPSPAGPVITISRQHGTRGKQVGELLAKKLGVPFYCKDIAALVAKESGLSEEFTSLDYDDPGEKFRSLYLSTHVAQQSVIAQEKVLRKIAEKGSCVIVGRAANYVLRSLPNVISIFLYAPENVRIKNIEEMYGDSYDEARAHMISSDEARGAYYRGISGESWQDMNKYDLCLDVSMGKEKAAELLENFIRSRTL